MEPSSNLWSRNTKPISTGQWRSFRLRISAYPLLLTYQDVRFLSEVEKGVYITDPLRDVHPDIPARYYGTGGPPLSHIDAEDSDVQTRTMLHEEIIADMQSNLHDQPVHVPNNSNPFASPEAEIKLTISHVQTLTIFPRLMLRFQYQKTNSVWHQAVCHFRIRLGLGLRCCIGRKP
jgi:hypothetical protein